MPYGSIIATPDDFTAFDAKGTARRLS